MTGPLCGAYHCRMGVCVCASGFCLLGAVRCAVLGAVSRHGRVVVVSGAMACPAHNTCVTRPLCRVPVRAEPYVGSGATRTVYTRRKTQAEAP